MQKSKPAKFRFGRFEANLLNGSLYENGKRVQLQEKPFQLLAAILQGLGNVVTREEAASIMWPHTHVQTDQGLNAATRKVRLALGDSSEKPRYIETLGSRGYRFIHPFEVIASTGNFGTENETTPLRVAVLPTDDQSGALEEQARGFSNELTALLRSAAPEVKVFSNGDLKDRNLEGRSFDEIGRELQVEFVVAARVRRTQNRLRLTTMLFQTDDTQCVWAETYENEAEKFAVDRSSLADKVARSLSSKFIQRSNH